MQEYKPFTASEVPSVMAVAAAGTIGGAVGGASIMVLWTLISLVIEGTHANDPGDAFLFIGIAALIGAFLGGLTGLGAGAVTARPGFPRRVKTTTVLLGTLVGWIGLAVLYPVFYSNEVDLRSSAEYLFNLIGVSGAFGGAIGGLVGGWCLGWMPHSSRP